MTVADAHDERKQPRMTKKKACFLGFAFQQSLYRCAISCQSWRCIQKRDKSSSQHSTTWRTEMLRDRAGAMVDGHSCRNEALSYIR
jgi:hypothetical protein